MAKERSSLFSRVRKLPSTTAEYVKEKPVRRGIPTGLAGALGLVVAGLVGFGAIKYVIAPTVGAVNGALNRNTTVFDGDVNGRRVLYKQLESVLGGDDHFMKEWRNENDYHIFIDRDNARIGEAKIDEIESKVLGQEYGFEREENNGFYTFFVDGEQETDPAVVASLGRLFDRADERYEDNRVSIYGKADPDLHTGSIETEDDSAQKRIELYDSLIR